MNDWKTRIQNSVQRMDRYFKESQDSITDSNLSLIQGISIIGIFMIGLLMIVAGQLIENWTVSIGHILFLPFFAIYYFWSNHLRKKKEDGERTQPYWVYKLMVLSFMSIFMALVIYIEIVPYPEKVSTLVTPALIMLPVVFIVPLPIALIFLFISYTAFCVLSAYYMSVELLRANMFNGLVGMLFGFWIAWIVTNLRAREEHSKQIIIKESQQDHLTGVLNKVTVEQRICEYLELHQESDCALIVIDIDGFKSVNDSYGHQVGDRVLHILGDILQTVFREWDIKGRIGGDEFVVLMKNISDEDMVIRKMDIFVKKFEETTSKQLHHEITCSYGAIVKAESYLPYNPFFEEADKLLYEAKSNGKAKGKVKMLEL